MERARLHPGTQSAFRELGDARDMTDALANMALARLHLGDYAQAQDLGVQSLTLGQELGQRLTNLHGLGKELV